MCNTKAPVQNVCNGKWKKFKKKKKKTLLIQEPEDKDLIPASNTH